MKRFISLAAMAALLVGCGAKKEDEENKKNLQDGTWIEACRSNGSESNSFKFLGLEDDTGSGDNNGDSAPSYSKMTLKFEASTFIAEQGEYSDATCATQTMGSKLEGTYKAGDDAEKPGTSVEGATAIDIAVTSVQMKIMKEDMLAQVATACTPAPTLNTYFDMSTCNFGDGDGKDHGPKKGETWYMIFKASDTELYWGNEDDTNNGSTPALRPSKLETSKMTKS